VCRPAGEDMFNILRKGRENGLRADRRILSNPLRKDIAEDVGAHQAVAR